MTAVTAEQTAEQTVEWPARAPVPADAASTPTRRKHPVLYILHSGNLYGTERMALATLSAVADEFDGVVFAPPGPALKAAEAAGLRVRPFKERRELPRGIIAELRATPSATLVATGITHSLTAMAINLLFRRKLRHLHIVHGGGGEAGSYGRKRLLNRAKVTFVTVSEFARERLTANGVRGDRIAVVPNFLTDEYLAKAPRRGPYTADGVRNVLVVSRMDPLKRVSILLDALDRAKDRAKTPLAGVTFTVLGLGPEVQALRDRAARDHPNVRFPGFCSDVAAELAKADLLLHTCPVESFGLAVLEAMAARLVTLVPNKGGTAALVDDGVSGFEFKADDPDDLARRLAEVCALPAARLDAVAGAGWQSAHTRFASGPAVAQYRELFRPE